MNTRIILVSFLAHTVRPTDGWYLAAGGYPSHDDCGAAMSAVRPRRTGRDRL